MSKVLAEAPKNSKGCQVTLKRRLVNHTADLAREKKPYYMEAEEIPHWLRALATYITRTIIFIPAPCNKLDVPKMLVISAPRDLISHFIFHICSP